MVLYGDSVGLVCALCLALRCITTPKSWGFSLDCLECCNRL